MTSSNKPTEMLLSIAHVFDSDSDLLDHLLDIKDNEIALTKFNPYPIGAIYMSTLDTDPADLFGGKWQALDEGRVLIGANSKYIAGSKGGEETHILTSSEMPSHSHRANTGSGGSHYHGSPLPECETSKLKAFFGWYDTRWDKKGRGNKGHDYNWNFSHFAYTNTAGSHSHSVYGSIYNAGDNQAHNNMMPYLAVYMWQRIE